VLILPSFLFCRLSPGNGTEIPGSLVTPIEQLIRQNRLAQPQFTVTLIKVVEPSTTAEGGRLTLGGLDKERMLGEVVWVESTSVVFWGFEIAKGSIKFGGLDAWDYNEKPMRISKSRESMSEVAIPLLKAVFNSLQSSTRAPLLFSCQRRWLRIYMTRSMAQSTTQYETDGTFLVRLAETTMKIC
jgi:hypothetical protein